MSLTCWHVIVYIQRINKLKGWQKILLSLLSCCVFSNVFFFIFNPIFKDFPFRTAVNPLYIRILMLSSRGILMSVILIPGSYYIHKDLEARRAQREHQKLKLKRVKVEKKLLETEVFERTKALHQALITMQKTQKDLEHQIFIQSRLLASFNHDIRGPFKFTVVIAGKIAKLASSEGEQSAIYRYATELNTSLNSTFNFVKNFLEFTKLPILQKIEKSENVNLRNLVEEKAQLFTGSMAFKENSLINHLKEDVHVESNYNLLGIVLHNLIDNANKFTEKGTIIIEADTTDQMPTLIIHNQGAYIPTHIMAWFNSDNNPSAYDSTENQNKANGIGLLLVKELAVVLGISVHIGSGPSGTLVTISF